MSVVPAASMAARQLTDEYDLVADSSQLLRVRAAEHDVSVVTRSTEEILSQHVIPFATRLSAMLHIAPCDAIALLAAHKYDEDNAANAAYDAIAAADSAQE